MDAKKLKKVKEYMLLALVLLVGFFAVMGTHFSDNAKSIFGANLWIGIQVVCGLAWVGGWLWLRSKTKRDQ